MRWAIVALRKESVDRNYWGDKSPDCCCKSLSARRAWIEMRHLIPNSGTLRVALRKESVDRNKGIINRLMVGQSRSPQGERG